jgi:hypothetical protein
LNREARPRLSARAAQKSCAVFGDSMRFFLRDGDRVYFGSPPPRIVPGTPVVLFDPRRPDGRKYLVHRLFRKGAALRTRGDWSVGWDAPDGILLGEVLAVERNGVRLPWTGWPARLFDVVFFAGSRTAFHADRAVRTLWEASLKRVSKSRSTGSLPFRRLLLGAAPALESFRRWLTGTGEAASDGAWCLYRLLFARHE